MIFHRVGIDRIYIPTFTIACAKKWQNKDPIKGGTTVVLQFASLCQWKIVPIR